MHRKELPWVSSRGALMGRRREYPCKHYRDAPLENKRKHPWTTKRAPRGAPLVPEESTPVKQKTPPLEALQGHTLEPQKRVPLEALQVCTKESNSGFPPGVY